jgi:hypothetical protein
MERIDLEALKMIECYPELCKASLDAVMPVQAAPVAPVAISEAITQPQSGNADTPVSV